MPKKLLSCVLFVMLFAYAHAGWSQDRGYLIQDATVIPELGTGYNSATLTPLTETCIDWDAKINDTSVDYGAPATSGVQRLDESSDIAATLDLSYRSIFTALKSSESVEADINSRLHYSSNEVTFVLRKTVLRQPRVIDVRTIKLKDGLPTDSVAFREQCGDYYVRGIIAGFKFYGILKIDKSAFDSFISAHVKSDTSVEALLASEKATTDVKATLTTAFSRDSLTITEKAKGGGDTTLQATNLEELANDYRTFPKEGKPAPIKVILAPYPRRQASVLSSKQQMLEDNAKLWYQYRQLVDVADNALGKPEAFFPFKPGTVSPWDEDYVQDLRSQIVARQNKIADSITACGNDPGQCQPLRDALAKTQTPAAYKKQLPLFAAWPGSCAQLATLTSPVPDGKYTLFYTHNARWSYTAFCKGMNSSAQTYFDFGIAGRSPSGSDPGANFFQYAPTGSGAKENWWDGTLVTSVYDMVEVDPSTMEVIQRGDDPTGRRDSGRISFNNGNSTFTNVSYGSPGECNNAVADQAKGRIDLRRTNFRVSNQTNLAGTGYNASGGSVTYREDRQVVDLSTPRGYCATIAGHVFLEPKASLK